MKHFITGVCTEILTPFDENKEVDYDKLEQMIDWQMEKGIKTFFVNGLGAECQSLTFDEKLKVLECVKSRTKDDAKIMACSFENDLNLNKKLLKAYEDSNLADCYCITAPPFFKHTQDALFDFAGQLISFVDKPVYIYNCVQMGTLFEPYTIKRLYDKYSNFRGFKDASVSILNFMQCTLLIDPNEFDFLGGCDGLDGTMMLLGAVGCVSFMAVPFPTEMMDICKYGLSGEYKSCVKAQEKVLKIRNVVKKAPFNAAYIYAMKYGGGPVDMHSRMPIDQDFVSDEVKRELDELISELNN